MRKCEVIYVSLMQLLAEETKVRNHLNKVTFSFINYYKIKSAKSCTISHASRYDDLTLISLHSCALYGTRRAELRC
jgi:hypothetical protein